jgi:hypothetical protein
MKICSKCKEEYSVPYTDYFNKKSGTKDGLQRSCKKCVAIFHKEHYENNKNYYKNKASKHNETYRVRNLQYMIDYLKEHPCVDCGESDPVILEFDHHSDKSYNVSAMRTLSFQKIIKEINKCDIRCANCHRRKTAKQFNWYEGVNL